MRKGGILLPISALPSFGGIGTFGKKAYEFVDFLKASGQKLWQILPLGPTSVGDSPYQSFSSFAGNPYFIDPELLEQDGYLEKSDYCDENWGENPNRIDYGAVYNSRFKMLRKAYAGFITAIPDGFVNFCNDNADWLDEYSLFMAIKDARGGDSWDKWGKPIKFRQADGLHFTKRHYADDILFHKFLQYLFHRQWSDLKRYANDRGIEIIGDIPIYVSFDSADVWQAPQNFQLDENLAPTLVAGCPPDAFSSTGQLWGNPLFDWDYMKSNGYLWWKKRIKKAMELYDIIRIDHFRGFESYYAIPYGDKTAENGKWIKGPDFDFISAIKQEFGDIKIIAEDLGMLTPPVYELLKKSGFPGMKVLQFAFDPYGDSDYLLHNHIKNCVVYTGTHDNDTAIGWHNSLSHDERTFADRYLHLSEFEGYNWGLMRGAWMSVADTAIVTMQDVLGLDSNARMNTPSKSGYPNWCWRCTDNAFDLNLAKRLYENMQTYRRL